MKGKMNITIVYIEDEAKMREDAFLDDIRDEVDDIQFFEKPSEGLSYIRDNLNKNIVVILDWKFNSSSIQGNDVLEAIDKNSVLVPVIVFTGAKIDANEAYMMFKGKAFSCVPKDGTTELLVTAIHDAYNRMQNDIRSVMEKWILKQNSEKRNKPYMRSGDKVYTLNDVLASIRKQDDFGKEITRGILSLATELFTNNIDKK